MSLILRDQYIRSCWVPAHLRVPQHRPGREHFPIQCWGVIQEPSMEVDGETMFADVVAWWPALGKWTVTHQCRADEDATDHVVVVLWWQPLPPLPRM